MVSANYLLYFACLLENVARCPIRYYTYVEVTMNFNTTRNFTAYIKKAYTVLKFMTYALVVLF